MFAIIKEGNADRLKEYLNSLKEDQKLIALTNTDSAGRTALHLAAAAGHLDIVNELIANDVDINARDFTGNTALDLTAEHADVAALLRTRMAWQDLAESGVGDKDKKIRFNRAIHFIQESFAKIALAREKNLVLMMGYTGAGKSTLINYLMGCLYQIKQAKLKTFIAERIDGIEWAEAGHGARSKTLYPQVFQKEGLDYVYCDLAGLKENRGEEERICAANSVQLLAQMKNKIKAIVVVLELSGISGRSLHLRESATVIGRILKQCKNPAIAKRVIFAITKAEGVAIEDILDAVKETVGDLTEKKSKNGLVEDDKALLSVLEMMQMHPQQIIMPDISDMGHSRTQIESMIAKISPSETTDYDFLNIIDSQMRFNSLLNILSHEFMTRYTRLNAIPAEIREIEDKIAEAKEQISNLEEKIATSHIEIEHSVVSEAEDKALEEQRTSLRHKRTEAANLTISHSKAESDLINLHKNLKDLNSDEPVHVSTRPYKHEMEWDHNGDREFLGLAGPRELGPAEGVGSHWIYHEEEKGNIVDYRLRPETSFRNVSISGNKFSAEFVYWKGETVHAYVDIDIAKKDVKTKEMEKKRADIAADIADLEASKTADQTRNNELKTEIDNLDMKIRSDEKLLMDKKIDMAIQQEKFKHEITRNEEMIAKANNKIAKMRQVIFVLQNEYNNLSLELEVNKPLFDIVNEVSGLLVLDDLIIRDFRDAFTLYNITRPIRIAINPSEESYTKSQDKSEITIDLPGIVHRVPGDGNCFFHAVAHELDRQGLGSYTHSQLREMAVQYLRDHPALMVHLPEAKINSYLTRMERDGVWAKGQVIEALAMALGVQLMICDIREGEMHPMHFHEGEGRPVIGLVLTGAVEGLGHYDALELIGAESAAIPSARSAQLFYSSRTTSAAAGAGASFS